MNSFKVVLISGAGQLGSRYLQGLAKVSEPLRIFVQDPSAESLKLAKVRWDEVEKSNPLHSVNYILNLSELPSKIDIAIIASTADVRLEIVEEISARAEVEYWILEKVLAQSIESIDNIGIQVEQSKGAWVNTPRRVIKWHEEIKAHLTKNKALECKVSGGMWGLACNAVHFLDLIEHWTGERLESINISQLNSNWFESKRKGFWEVSGTLLAHYDGGSIVKLTVNEDSGPYLITIKEESGYIWEIKENLGDALRSDGLMIRGYFAFQSELTSLMVESILKKGTCGLPAFKDSARIHKIFLNSMQEHWNNNSNVATLSVPIT